MQAVDIVYTHESDLNLPSTEMPQCCGMALQLCNTEELCDVGEPCSCWHLALMVNVIHFSHNIQGRYFVRLLSLVISCHLT